MTDVSFCEDGVGMERERQKRLFYFEDFSRYSPGGAGRRLYTPPVETLAPSAPGRTAQHRQQCRPCQNQGGQVPGQTMPTADHTSAHTPGRRTRYTGLHPIPDEPCRVDRDGGGRWRVCNPSIMRIMIALSQAWYIDSRLYKYHTNILLYLVIVNCYLSIDT